jgi:hypothetical protein
MRRLSRRLWLHKVLTTPAQIGPRGLWFDARVSHGQLPELAQVARDLPDTKVLMFTSLPVQGMREADFRSAPCPQGLPPRLQLAEQVGVPMRQAEGAYRIYDQALEARQVVIDSTIRCMRLSLGRQVHSLRKCLTKAMRGPWPSIHDGMFEATVYMPRRKVQNKTMGRSA